MVTVLADGRTRQADFREQGISARVTEREPQLTSSSFSAAHEVQVLSATLIRVSKFVDSEQVVRVMDVDAGTTMRYLCGCACACACVCVGVCVT
jgi:hypothetical protein